MERYRVRLSGDHLVFSAAHFITLAETECERLHGHNYHVAVEVDGPLTDDQLVVDFVALEALAREILASIDHRVLLPAESRQIRVAAEGKEIVARYGDRRWIFPAEDCRLLPIANTTAECLARFIAVALQSGIRDRLRAAADRVIVEVRESSGCAAICELADAL